MVYCDRCDRYFPHFPALAQHERDSAAHNICYDCENDYTTWNALKEHWVQSPFHDYCQYCDEHFDDEDDLEDHYQSSHSYCRSCQRVFKDEYGLHEHYRQSPAHDYCASCKRLFQSDSHLQTVRTLKEILRYPSCMLIVLRSTFDPPFIALRMFLVLSEGVMKSLSLALPSSSIWSPVVAVPELTVPPSTVMSWKRTKTVSSQIPLVF